MRISPVIFLYRLAQILALPFIALYFLARLVARPSERAHFGERLGLLPRSFTRTQAGCIWLHCVSVGEAVSAVPFIREWRNRYPQTPIYMSVTTVAGRRAAIRQASGLVDGVFYAPIDYASCIRRVLGTIRPWMVAVFETEIWPNLFSETKRAGLALALVNARISDRAWPKYAGKKWFFQPVLRFADCVAVQSDTDSGRYTQLGVSADHIHALGNLKYDAAPLAAEQKKLWRRPVWIAASTVADAGTDEDDLVIEAFRQLRTKAPDLLLILAPRQPARFDVVAEKLTQAGIAFTRRSEGAGQLRDVLLLDTIGELASLYSQADVVFVGGSIAKRGGHNILEPAAAGVPVVVGPHMENFAAIARDFLNADAMVQLSSGEDLASAIHGLLSNHDRAKALGARGRQLVLNNRGCATRMVDLIAPFYFAAFPRARGNFFLRALARLWIAGGRRKRRSGERVAAERLPLPARTISIGGITMGGAGKTPLCASIARELKARGQRPVILTRGYHRRSPAETVVLAPGAHAPSALTGDEAQVFLRAGDAIVAIGSDRYASAQAVLKMRPDAGPFLLDDGFQHARMNRDIDVAVIDGLDPFGGEAVFPVGRLREPLEALRRADLFVITRAPSGERAGAIAARLRKYNAQAEIVAGSLRVSGWRAYPDRSARTIAPKTKVAAFCGLGNPNSFWNTLDQLGMNTVMRWAFGDHHQYKPNEFHRLAIQARLHGAEMLVTTEKDTYNITHDAEAMLKGMPLAWLEIELLLDEPEKLFRMLD